MYMAEGQDVDNIIRLTSTCFFRGKMSNPETPEKQELIKFLRGLKSILFWKSRNLSKTAWDFKELSTTYSRLARTLKRIGYGGHPSAVCLRQIKRTLNLPRDEYFKLCVLCEQVPYEILYLFVVHKDRVKFWKKLDKSIKFNVDGACRHNACGEASFLRHGTCNVEVVCSLLKEQLRKCTKKIERERINRVISLLLSNTKRLKLVESLVDRVAKGGTKDFYYKLCYVTHSIPKSVRLKLSNNPILWHKLYNEHIDSLNVRNRKRNKEVFKLLNQT